jgi:hypothetical protein
MWKYSLGKVAHLVQSLIICCDSRSFLIKLVKFEKVLIPKNRRKESIIELGVD